MIKKSTGYTISGYLTHVATGSRSTAVPRYSSSMYTIWNRIRVEIYSGTFVSFTRAWSHAYASRSHHTKHLFSSSSHTRRNRMWKTGSRIFKHHLAHLRWRRPDGAARVAIGLPSRKPAIRLIRLSRGRRPAAGSPTVTPARAAPARATLRMRHCGSPFPSSRLGMM